MDREREENLVQQAQQGDRDSYGRLADLYGGSVLAIAYSRLGDFAASQDIAQDALVLAFEKLGQLRRPQDFGAWLRTIVRNLCHRWQRNQAYRRRLREDCAALRERLGHRETAAPRENLEANETTRLIDASLQGLPPKEREAILLYYFEGKSVNEAARLAGISPVAMRKRLQRARDRLRDVLNAHVEAGLLEVAGRRKVSGLVLAAVPTGATYGRVASGSSVIPSSLSLILEGVTSGTATKILAGTVAALLLASAFLAVRQGHDAQSPAATLVDSGDSQSVPATNADLTLAANAGTAHRDTEPDTDAKATEGASVGKATTGGLTQYAAVVSQGEEGGETASISGSVHGADGNPVSGALVEAILRNECNDPLAMVREVAAEATTDADGMYGLDTLPVTEHMLLLFVSHADWANGGGRLDALAAGESREQIDFTLVPPTTVTGIVVDEDDRPIQGASVFLCRAAHPERFDGNRDAPSMPASRYGCLARATADNDGVFRLDRVPKGWVVSRLGAWKQGYALNYAFSKETDELAGRLMNSGAGTPWWASDIPPGAKDIRIVLKRGGGIRGRVVLAETGEPISGAIIALDGTIEAKALEHGRVGYEHAGISDDRGEFHMDDLPHDDLRVCVAKDGLMCAPRTAKVVPGKKIDLGTFELSPPGGFSGVALDADTGRPIPRFMVAYQLRNVYGSIDWVRTDTQGHYHAESVPAGEWRVFAYTGDWELSRQHHVPARHQNHIIVSVKSGQLAEGVNLHFVKTHDPRGSVRGKVIGRNGMPVVGAEVRIARSRQAVTDAQGAYKNVRVESGTRTVIAADPATKQYGMVTVEVPDGGEVVADIQLNQTAGVLSGHIVDEAGEVVEPGIRVTVECPDVSTFSVQTDELGAYTTGPIPPGRCCLRLHSAPAGYRVESRDHELTLNEGDDVTVDFVLIPMAGFVAGTAVYSDGSPAANLKVVTGSSNGLLRGQTDGEGRFRLEPIDGESLYVRVGDPESQSPWAHVKGIKLNRDDVRIVLHAPGMLKGYVAPVEGDPQPPSVSVMSPDYHTYIRLEQGSFSIPLQPGAYAVTVRTSSRHRVFQDIVVASGMETDMGTIELDGGTGVVAGTVAVQGLPENASETAIHVQARVMEGEKTDVSSPTVEAVDGAYQLDRLYPGRYVVIARVTYGGAIRQLYQFVDVSDGSEARADFTAKLGDATLSGTVALGSTEQRQPAYPVFVFKPGTCPFSEGQTPTDQSYMDNLVAMAMAMPPDGAFTCEGLAAGTYDVAAMRPGKDRTIARVDIQRVTVEAGGQAAVHLDIAE